MATSTSSKSLQTPFASPKHVVIAFLQRSRDQWKAKCVEAKRERKRFYNDAKAVRASRDKWKAKTQELRLQNRALQAELQRRKDQETQEERPSKKA